MYSWYMTRVLLVYFMLRCKMSQILHVFFTEFSFYAEIIHNYEIVKPNIVQHSSSSDEVSSKWCELEQSMH